MKPSLSLVVAAAAAAFSTVAFAQEGLPTQKMLTLDVAQTIAQDALAQCRANGYKVTVTVVDSANILKAFLRDDGAGMATVEVGRMKANSVMAFGRPSGPPPNLPPGTPAPPPVVPGTINAMGGVPIKVDNQLIGAVSVSGAPGGEKDAACANAALAKVADKLK
ncbi:MAG TPA: heme-binding protein [Bryobacteraceae bacterium]|nr:heme-binding protein [Bryobacteraceae bacterium]